MLNPQSRRNFIKKAGLAAAIATSAAMPLTGFAAEPTIKRVVFVFIPGGASPQHWQAKGCDGNFTLGRMSAPLEPIKQHLVFINHLSMTNAGHGFPFNALGGWYGPVRESLDVKLGAALGKNTLFRNITLNSGSESFGSVSKTLEGTTPAVADPFKAYSMLFSDLPAQKKGILDEGLDANNYGEIRQNLDKLTQLHTHLSVLALQRNKTNVVSLMLGSDQDGLMVPVGNSLRDYHSVISGSPLENFINARAYLTQKFTYLVQLLEATKDSDGISLLDSTLVVLTTDMGDGTSHTQGDAPFLLAGGKSFLRTNRLVEGLGYTHLDLMDTVSTLMGVPSAYYGKGPIAAIIK